MRDMLTEDDEEDDHDRYEGPSHQSHVQQRPQLSSDDFPAVSSTIHKSNHQKLTDDSALPASASWAKIGTNSTPSTPVLAVSDSFGPTLSAAVAASQQKTQFPPMPKRKSEKKKRKEQLQQQKATPELPSATANTSSKTEPTDQQQQQQQQQQELATASSPTSSSTCSAAQQAAVPSIFEQGLTGFVLGQAYRDLCPLPTEAEFESKQKQDDQAAEDLTLGVSALLLEDNAVAEPSPAQRNLEAIQSASTSTLIPSTVPSVLDFLTYSTPTPKYTGLFNPFSHMAILGAQHPGGAAALLNANNLDSPVRRHSRFGFAQA
jgi:hypothetical protein